MTQDGVIYGHVTYNHVILIVPFLGHVTHMIGIGITDRTIGHVTIDHVIGAVIVDHVTYNGRPFGA